MQFGILETILCVLLTALIITATFRRANLPVVLGYLVVGVVMGPHALGILPDLKDIQELAEFGVVFLMFTIGLEFSVPKFLALRNAVFFIGGLQVLCTIFIVMLIGKLVGLSMLPSLVIGGIASMSSTAIVVKQLNDQLELHSPFGLNAIGILLLQDLAVVPFIILIVSLSQNSHAALSALFFWAFLKGISAILLIYIISKWTIRPLFLLIAKTGVVELFTLTVLLITLTAAWLTNILGLSYALGAFLAGLMLAETEFRQQIEVEIRPFRDILLGLFFITIGMLADVSHWHTVWPWILLLLVAIVMGKMLVIFGISLLAGKSPSVSFRTGLVLAQGGEFGFAILTIALSHDMVPTDYSQVILAALLLSIAISPILICFNKTIAQLIFPKSMLSWDRTINKDLSNHDALLRKLFPESFEDNTESLLHENLVPILLEKNAYAIGHKLTEFHLEKLGVKIIAIRRYKEKPLKPPKKLIFQKHDIVLLYGSPDSIEDAELLLLEGP